MTVVVLELKVLGQAVDCVEHSGDPLYEVPVDVYHPDPVHWRPALTELQSLLETFLGLNGDEEQFELCNEAEYNSTLAQLLPLFDLLSAQPLWVRHYHPDVFKIQLLTRNTIALFYRPVLPRRPLWLLKTNSNPSPPSRSTSILSRYWGSGTATLRY